MKVLSLCLLSGLVCFSIIPPTLAYSPQDNTKQQSEKIYEVKEVDRTATITSNPLPRYTEQARRNRTTAWVVLRVVLKASGEIGDIKVIREAPEGLTEECVKVAREIKFEPAIKDGGPVSVYVNVEYNFKTD